VVILCPWNSAVGSSWARVVLAVHCILSRVDGRLVGGIHSVGRWS